MRAGAKIFLIVGCLFLYSVAIFNIGKYSETENPSGAPESGVTSRIKTVYEAIGSSTSDAPNMLGWGDWGAMWNRIYSASVWTPTASSNGALEANVASGYKFFQGTNRQELTGTLVAAPAIDYSLQKNATRDDYLGTYKGEEATWTDVGTYAVGSTGLSSGLVRLDGRTNLKWSASSTATNITNSFTLTADGARPTGGNAIAFCNGLNSASFGGKTNWYLPTQKELMQAYIDGIYSQNTSFGIADYFWSSSEVSNGTTSMWYVYLGNGYTSNGNNANGCAVRCVSRD